MTRLRPTELAVEHAGAGAGANVSRRSLFRSAAGAGLVLAAVPWARGSSAQAASASGRGEWLAGDFHCHTVYSPDVWGGPDDDNTAPTSAYSYGHTPAQQIANAEARELDFLAITDHDGVRALRDPGYRSSKLVLVPGYEHSLSAPIIAHAGVFMPTVDLLPGVLRDASGSSGFVGNGGTRRFLEVVHERGGLAVLNHPYYGNPTGGDARTWPRGLQESQGFDAVEVWNTMWLTQHDVFPIYDPDNPLALQWWEQGFARLRRAAVGGSDNHYRSLDAIAGVGQPTTWVYAAARTAEAVLEGVRAGRTTVSWQPPGLGGPRLDLRATESWRGGRSSAIGGTAAAEGRLDVAVRVLRGEGQVLRLISTGRVVWQGRVNDADATIEVPVVLPFGGWLRAELLLDERYLLTALTSVIAAVGRAPLHARRSPTAGRPVTYDGSGDVTSLPGVAAVLAQADVAALPRCSCH